MDEPGFHFSGGRKADNVVDLREILDSFSQLEFESYVNANKNDFINWLRNSLGENKLADKLKGFYELEDYKRVIDENLNPSVVEDEPEEELEAKKEVAEESDNAKDLEKKEEYEKTGETEDAKENELPNSAKTETEKVDIENEVKDLIEKNKEITKSIQEDKKNLKSAPKFAGYSLTHPFSKEHIRHLLYGFGFGLIVGAIVIFILMNSGVL